MYVTRLIDTIYQQYRSIHMQTERVGLISKLLLSKTKWSCISPWFWFGGRNEERVLYFPMNPSDYSIPITHKKRWNNFDSSD